MNKLSLIATSVLLAASVQGFAQQEQLNAVKVSDQPVRAEATATSANAKADVKEYDIVVAKQDEVRKTPTNNPAHRNRNTKGIATQKVQPGMTMPQTTNEVK